MNPQKVGNLIKDIRKQNGLTQKDLADKYGVTYQAVSKWENGTNLPDISLIKQICDDFNMDVNDFLDGNNIQSTNKLINKNNRLLIVIIFLLVVIIGVLITIYIIKNHKDDNNTIEFKTITTTCDTFKVSGHLAYDEDKSAIHIDNITYCGGDDTTKYDSISCALYESGNVVFTCEEKNNLKIEDYLKELSIKVNNYKQQCKLYKEDTLNLSIEAKDKNNKIVSYKIPLHLDDEC